MNDPRSLLLLTCALLSGACGGSGEPASTVDAGASCVRADPTCSGAAPSYASDVRPILDQSCVTCHYPGSNLARGSLATYGAVSTVSGTTLGQVSACIMPPAGQPPLSAAARETLLTWLACGAPDN